MSESIRHYLHHYPQLGQRIMVDRSAVIIGQVQLGDDVSVWPHATIRGDANYIKVGNRTNVQDSCVLHVNPPTESNPQGSPLIIGDDVTIGHGAMLHGCTVGHRVLIGMASIVLDNTIIEDDVMVGVGSLVPSGKHLESGYLYLGRPARRVRALTSEEIVKLTRSAAGYVEMKNRYLG